MVVHNTYGNSPHRAYSGDINNLDDPATDVNCALLESSHTESLNGHETWTDVSGDEVSGTGYDSGGQSLTSPNLNHSSGTTTFSADDVIWNDSTITAGYAVVYEAGTGTLLTLVDFEGDETSENGDFSVEWSSGNIFSVET